MFDWFLKKTIPHYDEVENPKVRERYGIVSSILSIVLNAIMVIFKITFGYLTGSVAISADGLNNLSDMGSNLATLFGFKLSNKHPDSEHPYGHGRIEYIVGMIIAFLILYVGLNAFKDALDQIIAPTPVIFSYGALIALIISILIKLAMGFFNRYCANKISSPSLLAASQDSFNDVLSTSATLIALVASLFSDLPFDGIIGLLVAILVLKSGIEIFKNTMDPLLGQAPDKEMVSSVVSFIKSFKVTKGIHDLMVHDYGPGRKYMSVHVEVDSKEDIMKIHDEIDMIERELLEKFNILTTIHMDPIVIGDSRVDELKLKVAKAVKEVNDNYTIHDFRMVEGISHTNLIFDVVLPSSDISDHEMIRQKIDAKIKELDPKFCTVIQIEHAYL